MKNSISAQTAWVVYALSLLAVPAVLLGVVERAPLVSATLVAVIVAVGVGVVKADR